MKTNNARLLVVDDNELNREVLSRRLRRAGYSVETIAGGQEAITFLEKEAVDLVLLDIEMPDVSGLDVLRHLRTKYSPAILPIIMVTALSDSADVIQSLDMGANDYVTKPVDLPVVMARIRTQLTLKRTEEARRESEERFALAVAGSNDGIWDWDLRKNHVFYSQRWQSALGYDPGDIHPLPEEWFSRIHPEDRARVDLDFQTHLQGIDPQFESEHRMLHRDGAYRWMLSRGIAVRDDGGVAYRIAGSQTDITSGKVTCPLTGLPNRLLFMDRLGRLLERVKRKKDLKFAVLFIDFDRFKLINDSLGHMVGDQFLIAAAQRLEHDLRATDTISVGDEEATLARLGGDEFTVLLDTITDSADAVRIGERLLHGMNRPLTIAGHEIFPSVSVGVAIGSESYEHPEDLLRDADTAMYRAKTLGRNRVELFDSEMRASVVARLRLETELRHATERKEFRNVYQPIVSLSNGHIHGFEALVRWHHPSFGVILPDQFIPVAEENGTIIPIGRWALNEACRQAWVLQQMQKSHPPLIMSVNLSARQFIQKNVLHQVREALEAVRIDPSSLTLEITESVLMHEPETAKEIFKELKSIGVRIGIDDFGTGYSSLRYLHIFPLDTLKIDRSFVSGMEHDASKFEIVRTTVVLAHNLGLEVIAEGVENAEQLLLLKDLGCEYAQGYLYSKPVDSIAAGDLVSANPVWSSETLQMPSLSQHSTR